MINLTEAMDITAYQQVFSSQGLQALIPVAYYAVGIAIYGIIVWHFYRQLARRDIFALRIEKSSTRWDAVKTGLKTLIYGLKYIVLFPLFVFAWFGVLSLLLLLLSKNQTLPTILLISMGVVAGVRIAAYYSEDLSRDLAKMLPFALLAVFLVDRAFLNTELIKSNFAAIPSFAPTILLYGLFVVALEIVLRVIYSVVRQFTSETKGDPKDSRK